MTLDKAIRKVGKEMGSAKYGHAMMGSMLPCGEIGAAKTLAVLFDDSVGSIEGRLHKIMDVECNRHFNRGWKKHRK